MITTLIKPRNGKLVLDRLIGNNCPEFRNGLLNIYFFKLTLGSDYLEHFLRQSFPKQSLLSNITTIPIASTSAL